MELKESAEYYNGTFGFNVLPLEEKKPAIGSWVKWETTKQTENDIDKMDWKDCTGVGGVSGIDNLRVIDVDYFEDIELLTKLLSVLGLPEDYRWSVISGSKKGYHIWFLMEESEEFLKVLGGEKAVYKIFPKEKGVCDHYEIRWKDCQTALPPSLHKSGNKYEFVFKNPYEAPQTVSLKRLKMFLEKFGEVKGTVINKGRKPQSRKDAKELKDVDKKELERAIEVLAEKLPEHSYDEWLRLGFALASIGEDGRECFLRLSLANPNYSDSDEELNKKFDGLLKDYNGEITLGSLYSIASEYGYKRLEPEFWREDNNKIVIDQEKFSRFLIYHGFGKFSVGREYIFVRVVNNIVSEVTKSNIKDFVIEYVKSLPYQLSENCTNKNLLSTFMSERNKLFGESYLEFLETFNLDFKRDGEEKSFAYFKNCFVEITEEGIKVIDYNYLDGVIWEEQIIDRVFQLGESDTDFSKFLFNVCKGDRERLDALFSAIGYLQHNYKDANNTKAICFIDERLSESAFGRSGKGVVGNAIGKMCAVSKIDGRNFKFENSFAFQSVSLDTEVLYFDDVNKKFGFDKLFSIITDGIVVEKKNQDSYYIPFEKSPKILITTNYSLDGSDDSSLDRQFVVEFSDYYNKKRRPIDEFGKLFFTGWNESEWNAFYNFMLGCVRYYLKECLVEYDHVNLLQKQLIDSTKPEFIEFIQDIELSKEYEKRELFEKFKKEYPDFENYKQNTFTGWIKKYANLKELKYDDRKSGAKKIFTLSDSKAVSSINGQSEDKELALLDVTIP